MIISRGASVGYHILGVVWKYTSANVVDEYHHGGNIASPKNSRGVSFELKVKRDFVFA